MNVPSCETHFIGFPGDNSTNSAADLSGRRSMIFRVRPSLIERHFFMLPIPGKDTPMTARTARTTRTPGSGSPDSPEPRPIRILRLAQVLDVTGLGKSKLYELQAQGEFPMRVQMTRYCVGWVEGEVQEWLASRLARRPLAPSSPPPNANRRWEAR
jgi:prophage regulatory protein